MKIKKHKGLRVAVVVAMVLAFGPIGKPVPAIPANLEKLHKDHAVIEKRTF